MPQDPDWLRAELHLQDVLLPVHQLLHATHLHRSHQGNSGIMTPLLYELMVSRVGSSRILGRWASTWWRRGRKITWKWENSKCDSFHFTSAGLQQRWLRYQRLLLRAEHPADRGDVRQAVAQQHRGAHHPVSLYLIRQTDKGNDQESYQHLEAVFLLRLLNW